MGAPAAFAAARMSVSEPPSPVSIKVRPSDSRTIGHELLGRVVDLGTDAKRTYGLAVGDIVTTESHIPCGVCYQCRIGDTHVCADDKIIGISEDGCFADLVKLPARTIWRAPTGPECDSIVMAVEEYTYLGDFKPTPDNIYQWGVDEIRL